MDKIIFCDVDGVLNSSYGSGVGYYDVGGVEKRKVNNLKKIVDATGASVVIVSRANAMLGEKFNALRVAAIKQCGVNVADSIVDFYFSESKAEAIKRWLNKNNLNKVKIVVIDDCEDDLHEQFYKHFVHIKGKHGLTIKSANQAIQILNNSFNY